MKLRRHVVFMLSLIIVGLIPMAVNAQEWATEDFTIQIPDDYYVFTSDNPLSDPTWTEAGIENPTEIIEQFNEDSRSFLDVISGSNTESMYGIAYIVGENAKVQILVTRHQTTNSISVYNFGDLSKQEQQEFVDELKGDEEESGSSTLEIEYNQEIELYEEAEVPFIKLNVDAVDTDGVKMYETVYMTMLNGDAITFNVYSVDEEIPAAAEEMIKEITDSFHVTNYVDQNSSISTGEAVKAILLLVLLTALIVGTILYIRWKSKKDKKQKKEMAERLSAYRQKNGEHEVKGKLCYANVTKCSEEAIHTFSIYHSYLKNLIQLIIGMAFCVLLLIIAFASTDEWLLILLSIALAGYYIFKIATASSNMEKVQKKIYTRGSSDMAKYAFYENSFRVSGIQSVMSYPYFQITDVRAHKDFVYLYYGPENAYIVNKNSFANEVNAEEFVEFIKNKMHEGDKS